VWIVANLEADQPTSAGEIYQSSQMHEKNKPKILTLKPVAIGMMKLELMLTQCDGRRIRSLPAWPKDCTADFKLHAPNKTVIKGHVQNGNVTQLKVSTEYRTKDVVRAEK
jgi:hypothetical protein